MRDGFERNKLLDNRYLTVSPLNHGSFGMVFTAKDTWNARTVAVKCITKPGATQALQGICPAGIATDDRSEELAIHSKLPAHKHIVNLTSCFETKHHQYMVLEFCAHGDLYEAIRLQRGPRETEHVRDFMLQLVDAVDHLHSNGVYHRDIKPENIFLTASGNMKLGDFGLATRESWSTEFAVGSDRYMAPEQYDASVYGYGYSPASADVWAIGIVLLNILFQRNPFATPTLKDPLFADFANDRQTLFDVFPNMSQDTYNVIRHSLALDPGNRSLGAVKEALKSVVSFTIDDETLDDFCTERNEATPIATAAREPLRTPSITSPNGNGGPFQWPVLPTPQKQVGQLPSMPEEEPDLFPGSVQSTWQYVDADEASLSSNVDSGLGMSYKSTKSVKSLAPPKASTNFVGSLPITLSKAGKHLSPYGVSAFSKSWSDLWDEDNEPEDYAPNPNPHASHFDVNKPSTPRAQELSDELGSITPRQPKVEPDRSLLSSGTATPIPEAKPTLSKTLSSTILDKWAVLGNFRRAKQDPTQQPVLPEPRTPTAKATPSKSKYADAFANFASFGGAKLPRQASPPNVRNRAPSKTTSQAVPVRARSQSANGRVWERAQREHSPKHPPMPAAPDKWSLDNNWREHKSSSNKPLGHNMNVTTTPPDHPSGQTNANLHFNYIQSAAKGNKPYKHHNNAAASTDDFGDAEWVGGWRDFHL